MENLTTIIKKKFPIEVNFKKDELYGHDATFLFKQIFDKKICLFKHSNTEGIFRYLMCEKSDVDVYEVLVFNIWVGDKFPSPPKEVEIAALIAEAWNNAIKFNVTHESIKDLISMVVV